MSNTLRRKVAGSSRTDVELLAGISGGDISDLGALFDRYGDDVARMLTRLGVPAADVDDLVQQTFLEVPAAAVRFKPDGAVRPWLLGMAAMSARRHGRAVSRWLARLCTWKHESTELRPVTPAEEVELSAEARRALRALALLPEKKREAFVLVAMEGMSGDEASVALNVPVATVWTRLHHAKRELRRVMEEGE